MAGPHRDKKRGRRLEVRSSEEKLHILLHARAMPESERGAYMRAQGVHDGDLERWEQDALRGLCGAERSEAQQRRIAELLRDSKQKDKRLKEATALLELQKKVQALWADADDDTTHS